MLNSWGGGTSFKCWQPAGRAPTPGRGKHPDPVGGHRARPWRRSRRAQQLLHSVATSSGSTAPGEGLPRSTMATSPSSSRRPGLRDGSEDLSSSAKSGDKRSGEVLVWGPRSPRGSVTGWAWARGPWPGTPGAPASQINFSLFLLFLSSQTLYSLKQIIRPHTETKSNEKKLKTSPLSSVLASKFYRLWLLAI